MTRPIAPPYCPVETLAYLAEELPDDKRRALAVLLLDGLPEHDRLRALAEGMETLPHSTFTGEIDLGVNAAAVALLRNLGASVSRHPYAGGEDTAPCVIEQAEMRFGTVTARAQMNLIADSAHSEAA